MNPVVERESAAYLPTLPVVILLRLDRKETRCHRSLSASQTTGARVTAATAGPRGHVVTLDGEAHRDIVDGAVAGRRGD